METGDDVWMVEIDLFVGIKPNHAFVSTAYINITTSTSTDFL